MIKKRHVVALQAFVEHFGGFFSSQLIKHVFDRLEISENPGLAACVTGQIPARRQRRRVFLFFEEFSYKIATREQHNLCIGAGIN